MYKQTNAENWFNTYFHEYSETIITQSGNDEVKQRRLLKKLISWLEVYNEIEGVNDYV